MPSTILSVFSIHTYATYIHTTFSYPIHPLPFFSSGDPLEKIRKPLISKQVYEMIHVGDSYPVKWEAMKDKRDRRYENEERRLARADMKATLNRLVLIAERSNLHKVRGVIVLYFVSLWDCNCGTVPVTVNLLCIPLLSFIHPRYPLWACYGNTVIASFHNPYSHIILPSRIYFKLTPPPSSLPLSPPHLPSSSLLYFSPGLGCSIK